MLGIGVLLRNEDVLAHKVCLGSVTEPILYLQRENIPRYTDLVCHHGNIVEITVSREKVPLYSQIRKNRFLVVFISF